MRIVIIFTIFLISSCTSGVMDDSCITALDCAEGEVCQNGECVEKSIGDTGDTGDTGNTGDTGDSGNTGNTGDSGDTGNTGTDKDDVDNQDDKDIIDDSDLDVVPDEDTAPVCGNHVAEDGEDCDSAEINVEPPFSCNFFR